MDSKSDNYFFCCKLGISYKNHYSYSMKQTWLEYGKIEYFI